MNPSSTYIQPPFNTNYPSNMQFTPEQLQMMQLQNLQQQQMQQQQLSPVQMNVMVQEMQNYYQNIAMQLSNLFNTGNREKIDPFNLMEIARDGAKDIPRDKMNLFFKHLLQYTYKSSAAEISNHLEVNRQLAEIRAMLLKQLPQTPAATG